LRPRKALARRLPACQNRGDHHCGERGRDVEEVWRVIAALVLAWAVSVVGSSALLHEFGHAWTARAVGWKVVGLRWRWYGVVCVADTNGKPDQLWKVALGGLVTTALLALAFLAGTPLPEPASTLFELGFVVNAAYLLTNLVPIRPLDGRQVLAGLRRVRPR
jgi:Zn-dependent protease